jgi:hypothetical protein
MSPKEIEQIRATVKGMLDEVTKMLAREIAKMLVEKVADVLYVDPHQWSDRPCPTCRTISGLFGFDFGCNKFAKKKECRDAVCSTSG